MKKRCLFGILMVIILAGIVTPVIAAAVVPADFLVSPQQIIESNITCGRVTEVNADTCQRVEEMILKSTVRIRIETWSVKDGESGYDINFSTGHATLRDGRYLVTHNHFSVPLSIRPRDGEPEAYGVVTLSNAKGEILFKGPLSDFELVWEDLETLVIAYKDDGLFEKLGFVSVEFKEWSSVPLQVGMEVAQVDWDGATTRVDWATVQEVKVEEGVPRIVLADGIMIGASGGGIFWQGHHIANNWFREQLYVSGALISVTTTVALNSAQVAGQAGH